MQTRSTFVSWLWHLLQAVAAMLMMMSCGVAFAQDNVTQTTGDVEPAEQPQQATQTPPNNPEPAKENPPKENGAGGAETGAPANADQNAIEREAERAALAERLGVEAETLDAAGVAEQLAKIRERIDTREEALAAAQLQRTNATTIRDALQGQLGSLPPAAAAALIVPVANRTRQISSSAAAAAAISDELERTKALAARLQVFGEKLTAADAAAKSANAVQQTESRRQAERAEQDAVEQLRLAREREERERDATLRELLVRERKLAEELVALTREHSDALDQIQSETEADNASFSDAKARMLANVDELPAEPTTKQSKETIDPLFAELVQLRRETRDKLATVRDMASATRKAVDDAAERVEEAAADVAVEERRREQLGNAVGERRVSVASAAYNVAQAQLEILTEQLAAYRAREQAFKSRLSFTEDTLETLLPLISNAQRSTFFSLTQQNIDDAFHGAREGIRRIVAGAIERWNQLFALDLSSIAVWGWVWGFLRRLIVAILLMRVLLPFIPAQISRLNSMMFQRRFFRLRPRLTIKFIEVLHSMARPVVALFAVMHVVNFLVASFPEIEALRWAVHAYFGYWIPMELARVLVLPRWYRKEKGSRSAAELHLEETEASAMADIAGMEITRAKKLVRSVQVVVVFWLLATYVPELFLQVFGLTLLWWVVDRIAVFGFIGIVIWVISTWRDDIAAIFERLVGDRVPRVVEFVNQHKGKWWGVIPIAGASVVVIILELVSIVRRYALDTEAFRRASTFAFRKKIEMQAQQREDSDVPDVDVETLPESYTQLFRTDDLPPGSPLFVPRGDTLGELLTIHKKWIVAKRQGSIAIIGESGIGKTTLLNEMHAKFVEAGEEVNFQTAERMRFHRGDVLGYVAELFDMGEPPGTKAELIARVRQLDQRVIMLDDCHHLFMRRIGGFEGLGMLLDIVNLTDETHFWVLAFNVYAWSYLNRVSSREHYFGKVHTVGAWSDDQIQKLIETRNGQSDFAMSFSDLVVSHDDEEVDGADYFYEVVKTSRGYFRYLHEFSDGNPRVAMMYWLRSVRPQDDVVSVSLFRRPPSAHLEKMSDNHWFVLAALAQHGELDAREIADIINVDEGFCHLAINYFLEQGVVDIELDSERARLTSIFFRQVLKRLMNSNYLYR